MSCHFCGAETHAAQRCDTAEARRMLEARQKAHEGRLARWLYGNDDETTTQAGARLLLRYALIVLVPIAVLMFFFSTWLMHYSPTR